MTGLADDDQAGDSSGYGLSREETPLLGGGGGGGGGGDTFTQRSGYVPGSGGSGGGVINGVGGSGSSNDRVRSDTLDSDLGGGGAGAGGGDGQPQWVVDSRALAYKYRIALVIVVVIIAATTACYLALPHKPSTKTTKQGISFTDLEGYVLDVATCDAGKVVGLRVVDSVKSGGGGSGGGSSSSGSTNSSSSSSDSNNHNKNSSSTAAADINLNEASLTGASRYSKSKSKSKGKDSGGGDVKVEYELECLPPTFTWASYFSIAVAAIALVAMVFNQPPDLVMLSATIVLRVAQIITDTEAWAGFSNTGVLAVGALFVVARGVNESGAVYFLLRRVLGRPNSLFIAQMRMLFPVAVVSAFLNNTPVVAMMIPIIEGWSKVIQIPASKFLMPLSFASMLGGMCTLLGTSTNLIVAGLVTKAIPGYQIGLFDIAPVGLPAAVIGILFMAVLSGFMLPTLDDSDEGSGADGDEGAAAEEGKGGKAAAASTTAAGVSAAASSRSSKLGQHRYVVSFVVTPGSLLEGETIDGAGILLVESADVVRVVREGRAMAWSGETLLLADDIVQMTGNAKAIVKLRSFRGFVPLAPLAMLGRRRRKRLLVEVVLSASNHFCGKPLDNDELLRIYNAIAIAVRHRGGRERPNNRTSVLSDDLESESALAQPTDTPQTVLSQGDALLVETYPNFLEAYRDSEAFLMVREVLNSQPPRNNTTMDLFRMYAALVILVAMVVCASVGVVPLFVAACIASGMLIAIKCMTVDAAFRAIKPRVLLAIVATFGVGTALDNTGVADAIARVLVGAGLPLGSAGVLSAIILVTSVLTAILSNNAVAVLMLPIVLRAQEQTPNISINQYLITLMIGASASFITPIGYQTNMMVMTPGGYSFTDFTKFGAALQIVVLASAVVFTILFAH